MISESVIERMKSIGLLSGIVRLRGSHYEAVELLESYGLQIREHSPSRSYILLPDDDFDFRWDDESRVIGLIRYGTGGRLGRVEIQLFRFATVADRALFV